MLKVTLADGHGCRKKSAEGVAALLEHGHRVFLGSRDEQDGAGEGFYEGGVLDLRREVSEEKHSGIASRSDELGGGIGSVSACLDHRAVTLGAGDFYAEGIGGCDKPFRALFGERTWKAIAGC